MPKLTIEKYTNHKLNMDCSYQTISKKITHGEELIVVSRCEFEKLQQRLIEVKDALLKIRRGEKELRLGKTKIVKSLADLKK